MSEKITSPIGTVIWSDLATPDDNDNYVVRLAVDKDNEELLALVNFVDDEIKEKYGNKIPATFGMPFTDGDEKGKEYTAGKTIIRFSSKFQPEFLQPDGKTPLDPKDVYSGCTVRVRADAYIYNNKKVGIKLGLYCVQFAGHGTPIKGKGENHSTVMGAVPAETMTEPWDNQ